MKQLYITLVQFTFKRSLTKFDIKNYHVKKIVQFSS